MLLLCDVSGGFDVSVGIGFWRIRDGRLSWSGSRTGRVLRCYGRLGAEAQIDQRRRVDFARGRQLLIGLEAL